MPPFPPPTPRLTAIALAGLPRATVAPLDAVAVEPVEPSDRRAWSALPDLAGPWEPEPERFPLAGPWVHRAAPGGAPSNAPREINPVMRAAARSALNDALDSLLASGMAIGALETELESALDAAIERGHYGAPLEADEAPPASVSV